LLYNPSVLLSWSGTLTLIRWHIGEANSDFSVELVYDQGTRGNNVLFQLQLPCYSFKGITVDAVFCWNK